MTPAAYPLRPPWPPPGDLAPGVTIPPMDDREAFVSHVLDRYGDDAEFASRRWDAARRLLVDGDIGPPLLPEWLHAGKAASCDPATFPAARVLAAWLLTPREAFIPPLSREAAYLPHALPIGHDQTISAPYMVTRMTAALNPGPHDAVLEIGTGSGYQAAMLAVLSGRVHTVETVGPLAAAAGNRLDALAEKRPWLSSLRRRSGNGYPGWPERAPFDRIIVTCAIDHIPPALAEQTAPGGMIVLPLGESRVQQLLAFRRRRDGEEGPPDTMWQSVESPFGIPGGSDRWDVRDVYGDGSRVVFVPFVY